MAKKRSAAPAATSPSWDPFPLQAAPEIPVQAASKEGAWRTVNRIQLAELMGVHPDTITDHARSGMPVVTRGGRGRESAYDAVACLAWWRERIGRNAKEAAQTDLYSSNAELARLKLSQQMGALVPVQQVIQEGQAYTKGWVTLVRAWPRRLVQLGVITREQEGAVASVCRQLLLDISSWKTGGDIARTIKKKFHAA